MEEEKEKKEKAKTYHRLIPPHPSFGQLNHRFRRRRRTSNIRARAFSVFPADEGIGAVVGCSGTDWIRLELFGFWFCGCWCAGYVRAGAFAVFHTDEMVGILGRAGAMGIAVVMEVKVRRV